MASEYTLPSDTVLDKTFVIERNLGSGGFGKTYLARDRQLDRLVAIKEYFLQDYAVRDGRQVRPVSRDAVAVFENGLDRFRREAQLLRTVSHPSIVKVFRSFEENGTCYMVLEYIEGQDLEDWLVALGRPPTQAELDRLLVPVLSALGTVHAAGILHRDISPRNIRLRNRDNAPVLLDFGAAKSVTRPLKSITIRPIVKHGYSPQEVYTAGSKRQGPWTDIYGLAAVLYRALSGKAPPASMDRLVEPQGMTAAAELPLPAKAYRPSFLRAIDLGLAMAPENRPQTVAAWHAPLFASSTSVPVAADSGRPRSMPASATGPKPTAPPVSEPVKARRETTTTARPSVSRPVTVPSTTAPPTARARAPTGNTALGRRPNAAAVMPPPARAGSRRMPISLLVGAALVLVGGATLLGLTMRSPDSSGSSVLAGFNRDFAVGLPDLWPNSPPSNDGQNRRRPSKPAERADQDPPASKRARPANDDRPPQRTARPAEPSYQPPSGVGAGGGVGRSPVAQSGI